ncbi:MAG: DUF4278 domain-containing protein [Cyanobacteria bacterium P01_H01_bin.121]
MTLSYRGTKYDTTATQVAVTETALIGHYRGHEVHFLNGVQQPHAARTLHYRGVAY